jgi:hypothetical protein
MHPSAAITTRTNRSRYHVFELALLIALACSCADGAEAPDEGSDPGGDPGTGGETARELSVCYFGDSAIHCGPADDDARVRVDDFYPSACLDGDHDRDRVPDFMDMDDPGGDYDDDHPLPQLQPRPRPAGGLPLRGARRRGKARPRHGVCA